MPDTLHWGYALPFLTSNGDNCLNQGKRRNADTVSLGRFEYSNSVKYADAKKKKPSSRIKEYGQNACEHCGERPHPRTAVPLHDNEVKYREIHEVGQTHFIVID